MTPTLTPTQPRVKPSLDDGWGFTEPPPPDEDPTVLTVLAGGMLNKQVSSVGEESFFV